MNRVQEHLAQANGHIAELTVQIVRQRVIVKYALDTGYPSGMAESMLLALEESHYYDAIERAALNTLISDAQVVTSKKSRLVLTEKTAASSLRRRRFQFGQGSLHSVQDNGTGRIEVAEHRCR